MMVQTLGGARLAGFMRLDRPPSRRPRPPVDGEIELSAPTPPAARCGSAPSTGRR